MVSESLHLEHPTLARTTDALIAMLKRWREEVSPAPGGGAWMHHHEFAERAEHLAGHLEAVVLLAARSHHQSDLAVTRTALEHHLLDRLLLLADRYEEIVRHDDSAQVGAWEQEWDERSAPWTEDVVSVERISGGRALRLTRLGLSVKGDDGVERERISPYWAAMDHYNAFVGHPDHQADTLRPFDSLETRVDSARRNQSLYGAYLRWSSICHNLELSGLAGERELLQLRVHYGFLSAFTHATQTGYDVRSRPGPDVPSMEHVLSELALLYVCTIAIAETNTWATYVASRPHLLAPLRSDVVDLVDRLRPVVSYFWFLGGQPQDFDRYQEANRRAHPLVLTRGRPEIAPHQITDADVGYYDQPLERLQRLHTGENEMTTGFGFGPMWPELHW